MRAATYAGPSTGIIQPGDTIYVVPPSRCPAALRSVPKDHMVVTTRQDARTVSLVPSRFVRKAR